MPHRKLSVWTMASAVGSVALATLLASCVSAADTEQGQITVSAQFTAPMGEEPAQLFIVAEIEEGWHTFSITQARGGPRPTKITLAPSDQFKLLEKSFTASPPPETHYSDAWPGLPLEEHTGRVVWHVPIELAKGVDIRQLKIAGKVNAQRCDKDTCLPPKSFEFTAGLGKGVTLGADEQSAANRPLGTAPGGGLELFGAPSALPRLLTAATGQQEPGVYRSATNHAVIHGYVTPQTVSPGDTAQLVLRAEPADGWHVYSWAERDPEKVSKPTLIVFTERPDWQLTQPQASAAPDGVSGEQPYHSAPVTWTIDFAVPRDAEPGAFALAGIIGYQTCQENGCDVPHAANFSGTINVGAARVEGQRPLAFEPGKYRAAAKLAAGAPAAATPVAATPQVHAQVPLAPGGLDEASLRKHVTAEKPASLVLMLLSGFLGGAILNFMPCVLPVIGLKIMSFVQQGGHSRRRVLLLNIWYALGLMSVFMVLAVLAHVLGFGWGELFRYREFNIALAGIMFVMGLSFLGVWEIPIPGFVGSGKMGELATHEGPAGAFAKGMLTTLLATPCTGPFLATALAFAVRQPPFVIYLVFACVGLGMASPYLVLGAFPGLVRLLPKPGAWMETFKQVMGFFLFASVVYLFTFIHWTQFVPTIAMLAGLAAACWWVGRTSLTAELGAKVRTWCGAATFAMIMGLGAFHWLGPVMANRFQADVDAQIVKLKTEGPAVRTAAGHELPWQPYSWQTLDRLVREDKTVLVDFTADWCATCKTLEWGVLNTAETRQKVEANQVVTLVADWTDGEEDADVTRMLEILGGKQVPTLAIFPAGRPNEPIIVRGTYSTGHLLDLLTQAGPSKAGPSATSTAMGR